MMRQQLTLLGKTHGIYAVGLEHNDGKIGADGHYHQRQEEVVATRQFRYQKNARQRSMHHPAHHSCHAHQGKVLFRQKRRHVKLIAEM